MLHSQWKLVSANISTNINDNVRTNIYNDNISADITKKKTTTEKSFLDLFLGHTKVSKVIPRLTRTFQGQQDQQVHSKVSKVTPKSARSYNLSAT